MLLVQKRHDLLVRQPRGFGGIEETNTPIYRHPLLTVEMGGGNQIAYHRRPRLAGKDMIALVYTHLGVGANMIGYYVYHGTQHPLSWHDEYPTQESKKNIFPYPNDYPMISYDFLAPLTEWGFIRDYYHDFKLLHHFIHAFGSDLAPMYSILPKDNPTDPADSVSLRYSLRSRDGRGYIFFSNYVRHLKMKNHRGVRFKLELENEELVVPDNGIDIENGVYGILPFNYDMQGVLLKYATAHPFDILENGSKTYFFYAMDGIEPEFKFEDSNIAAIKVHNGKKSKAGGFIKVNGMKPSKDCSIDMTTITGDKIIILLLTEDEARYSYKFNIDGKQTLVITDKMAFYNENTKELEIRSLGSNEFDFFTFPEINVSSKEPAFIGQAGRFYHYHVALPKCEMPRVTFKDISDRKAYEAYCQSLQGKTPKWPTYSHLLDEKAPYVRYEMDLPTSMPEGVNDVLVELDYFGNTAQIYADGLLIADDYYSGSKMPFALRRHRDKSRLIFQVTPLMPEYEIYFEEGTELDFGYAQYAVLNGITVVPEYAMKIRLN